MFFPHSGKFSCVQKSGLGSLTLNTLNYFHSGTPIYTVTSCLSLQVQDIVTAGTRLCPSLSST